ncbi:rhamnogalacturonan acetylesterase [Isoptericola sp. NEAU-Y5]|uniref:Rhamnogalacturonan acetylesterase n=1 Tax=Isoptericola luteus TaxID=2879484 RepID=A0ABS7ZIU6_9MICO|nr:rhamnogalacturonan acetylesterase [Isoptericola sp. NEAU-Y5]MCA5893719.1 rhamnogalacturonan acetylesterase [Isoptericola sp. NEAU-Y5]
MPRTIHLVGDSTAAPKGAAAAPETGWGMALPFYLRDDVAVANHARNGRSTRSFAAEGRRGTALAAVSRGDVFVIQFGHNDAKADDPSRFTEPWSDYSEHLREYVRGARDAGAEPVLVTPVERRSFDEAGTALPTHGEYPDAVRAVAADEDVPLLDLQGDSLALWHGLGPEETKRYFLHADGRADDTHFSPLGAGAVARIVATGLLVAWALRDDEVHRLDESVPEDWFSWPADPPA